MEYPGISEMVNVTALCPTTLTPSPVPGPHTFSYIRPLRCRQIGPILRSILFPIHLTLSFGQVSRSARIIFRKILRRERFFSEIDTQDTILV